MSPFTNHAARSATTHTYLLFDGDELDDILVLQLGHHVELALPSNVLA